VFNRNVGLFLSDKYPQGYGLVTQGAQNSVPAPLGACVGVAPPNKAPTSKLKCETLEISGVSLINILCCPAICRQSNACRCYL